MTASFVDSTTKASSQTIMPFKFGNMDPSLYSALSLFPHAQSTTHTLFPATSLCLPQSLVQSSTGTSGLLFSSHKPQKRTPSAPFQTPPFFSKSFDNSSETSQPHQSESPAISSLQLLTRTSSFPTTTCSPQQTSENSSLTFSPQKPRYPNEKPPTPKISNGGDVALFPPPQ